MRLSVFTEYQKTSDKPFLCSNTDHEMVLVPFMTEDLNVELRCFYPECDYKIIPGLLTYTAIMTKQINND